MVHLILSVSIGLTVSLVPVLVVRAFERWYYGMYKREAVETLQRAGAGDEHRPLQG
ncbi:hypothetical protein ACFLYP_03815 [Chloroflexota bacterium]